MNPITHLLAGWAVANLDGLERRDRALVTAAGVIPDIDGLGLVAERLTLDSDRPILWWTDYHHVLAHNIGFGILIAGVCLVFGTKKKTAAFLALLSFHLHIFFDVIGAGGPGGEHWPIPYLLPFSNRVWLEWSGQWLINAWQNVVITAAFLAVAFLLAYRRGYSPLEMVSRRADAAFVDTLRRRFRYAKNEAQAPEKY